MAAVILRSSFAELEASAEFPALLEEYASEAGAKGLPRPKAKMEVYRQLEKLGALHVLSATVDGALVGFIFVLVQMAPHYSVLAAVSESFFVAKARRSTGAGINLLRAAVALARAEGAWGLFVNAPKGGDLEEVLPRMGFEQTSSTFFRPVPHE